MAQMSGKVFISYRRDDSSAWAGRLYDRLFQHFSQNEIFIDVDTIEPGVDFVEAIEEVVGACDVLIAVIGSRWLTSSDRGGRRRLDIPEDIVRLEIATALKRGIRVVPVLVEGATMPEIGELPDDLKALVRRNAVEIGHNRFNADSEILITALKRALGKATEQRERELSAKQAAPVAAMTPSPPVITTPSVEEKARSALEKATKQQPWVNSLGMKFVPVAGTQVLFSVWDTRVQDFEAFVADTNYDATGGMWSLGKDGWKQRGATWREPGFSQEPTHPVVGVSWNDAKRFCEWLTRREQVSGMLPRGWVYRLPTDAEWSGGVGLQGEAGNNPKEKDRALSVGQGVAAACWSWELRWGRGEEQGLALRL
jgi:Sulfatase-modifying factor enzyme 1/TIR domain